MEHVRARRQALIGDIKEITTLVYDPSMSGESVMPGPSGAANGNTAGGAGGCASGLRSSSSADTEVLPRREGKAPCTPEKPNVQGLVATAVKKRRRVQPIDLTLDVVDVSAELEAAPRK